MVIPAGKKIGKSNLGDIYLDQKGMFYCKELSLLELIEAMVTNGRGYIEAEGNNWMEILYSENPKKEELNPEIFCYKNLEMNKFPNFLENLREGHPDYSKIYFEEIELSNFK
jgi:hypothetical protein